ncbi:glycosyltransferase family A protein [Thalassospira sp. GB04J01]|uniref:glycosyltransferase family 2 protein n=1 Tax=Thalassospira sp. GB04J01 TaxID=1485225 RepID=UPI000C9CEAC6|nr:glycosyltransferase family A protein [Thalassospira sp. GB04J01]|tara:strand:- start:2642 stop:3493 length:852 start_codon:yes stop_codon:yes gene_type:complete
MLPSVSVVIPCYNGHAFLDQVVQSVFNQTVKPLEIIIVDDGSDNPETIKFLDEISSRVLLIRQENKGLPRARNVGFAAAKGEYILPLDCDDWLEPEFLEMGLKLITENEGIDFMFSWMSLEAESSGVLEKHYNFFEQLFLNQLPYCILQPRKIWEDLGGYDELMRKGYEDWEWNIRLGKAGYKGGVIKRPLFHYRVQSTAMLASISRRKHVDLWMFIREKHAGLYSGKELFAMWKIWRHSGSTRPLFLYFGWEALYRLLPKTLFRFLVSTLFSRAHSARFKKK